MKRFRLLILFLFMCTGIAVAQPDRDEYISPHDSVLLQQFWVKFKKAIDEQDKNGLTALFSFPFYCPQCADLTPTNDRYGATVKVNRTLFDTSIYRLFFDMPAMNDYNRKLWSRETLSFFPAYNDKNKRMGYQFSYAIVAPSKKWEGSQGFVTVRKIKGRYLVDGLYTVP